jgi:hypothetical protein
VGCRLKAGAAELEPSIFKTNVNESKDDRRLNEKIVHGLCLAEKLAPCIHWKSIEIGTGYIQWFESEKLFVTLLLPNGQFVNIILMSCL